jgi:DNA-binding HxlR family transcriptional regulator
MSVDCPTFPEIDTRVHEPARLRVLALLAIVDRADFMYLLRHTGLSKGNLSVQTSNLAEAGLVSVEKEFVGKRPRTSYSLTRRGREALRAYRHVMTGILGSLPD